ncbi:hypothetical protein AYI68_g4106 [Smittium mucronatum]|uniref:Uncharacterized protein n=1 Tax=Smittium mucronatum TaxID=133383 RepID=A0A1R0GY25_9FUNG|nr:hypothetical protein AYI68_g4106 [Smittium mucronatum]
MLIFEVEKSLLLTPVEPNFAGSTEDQTRAIDSDTSHITMEVSDLVSRPAKNQHLPTILTNNNECSTRPQKRQIYDFEQQEMVSSDMETQRCILKNQGLSDLDIEIFVSENVLERLNLESIPHSSAF